MANAMSEASKRRMMEGLEKVASLMSEGVSPNDALVKVANALKIPAGHIRLMASAVNTGSTNANRLKHEDPI